MQNTGEKEFNPLIAQDKRDHKQLRTLISRYGKG